MDKRKSETIIRFTKSHRDSERLMMIGESRFEPDWGEILNTPAEGPKPEPIEDIRSAIDSLLETTGFDPDKTTILFNDGQKKVMLEHARKQGKTTNGWTRAFIIDDPIKPDPKPIDHTKRTAMYNRMMARLAKDPHTTYTINITSRLRTPRQNEILAQAVRAVNQNYKGKNPHETAQHPLHLERKTST